MATRALLKVAAPSAVVLAMLASGTLAYSACSTTPDPASAQLKDLDSALNTFGNAWRNRDYVLARTAATQIRDTDLRSRLEQLLLFGQTRTAIEENRIREASLLARNLEPGTKRALISAALALRQATPRMRHKWLQIALTDAAEVRASHHKDLLALILPVVLEVDNDRGLRLLDEGLHEYAGTVSGLNRNTEPRKPEKARIVSAGSQLIEIVPGSTSRQVFVLSLPGMVRTDLRDLAVAYHGKLRCAHTAGHEVSPERRAAHIPYTAPTDPGQPRPSVTARNSGG